MTETTPTLQAQAWLNRFEQALAARDIDGAVALFGSDCFWRDLVSFTWNICTQESQDQIRAMLAARLDDVAPSHWRVDGEATAADGITEAWFTFETRLSRGKGLLRLKDAGGQQKAWTLLTTMVALKGFEEKTGEHRVAGAEHGVHKGRKSWAELRAEELATLGYSEQPDVVVIGGGQGASRSARGCGGWACRPSSSRRTRGPATAGATATRACACTTRSGTTTCPT